MSHIFAIILIIFLATLNHHKLEAQQPGVIKLRNWTYYAHGTRAGQVTILDKNRIQIENFNYDGAGPEAWFQIGLVKLGSKNVPQPCANHRSHPIIPDPTLQCSVKPGKYSDTKLILTIPKEYQWEDIDYVGLYCYKFQHLFGYVKIPYFSTSGLPAEMTQGSPCSDQHRRILNDSTSPVPVTCPPEKPSETSGGIFER